MNRKKLSVFSAALVLLSACSVPKELAQKIEATKKEKVELPLDYANVFPAQRFDQWDKDYNAYDRYLTPDIMKTQMGLSYLYNGVQVWHCMPSARTHVQLDTATMITDPKAIVGNWTNVCNRRVCYTDSVVYADKKIFRDTRLLHNETDADAFLSITNTKFNLYGADKPGASYKQVISKNYAIENKRFLMLYGMNKATAAISFVGIDKEGRLIINSYSIDERKVKGVYITYQAVMVQMVYKRAG